MTMNISNAWYVPQTVPVVIPTILDFANKVRGGSEIPKYNQNLNFVHDPSF